MEYGDEDWDMNEAEEVKDQTIPITAAPEDPVQIVHSDHMRPGFLKKI